MVTILCPHHAAVVASTIRAVPHLEPDLSPHFSPQPNQDFDPESTPADSTSRIQEQS